MIEPVRLVDDPDLSEAIRGDLRLLRAGRFPAAPGGLARLEAALEAAGSAPDPTPAQVTTSKGIVSISKGAFWGLSVTGIASVLIWSVMSTSRASDPVPVARAAVRDRVETVVMAVPRPAVLPVAEEAAEAPVRPDPPKAPAPARRPNAERRPAEPLASDSAEAPKPKRRLLEETEHLAALREELVNDPEGALAHAEEGDTRFTGGVLRQERESIAIEALARRGRLDEAMARARAFRLLYPASPYNGKIEALLKSAR